MWPGRWNEAHDLVFIAYSVLLSSVVGDGPSLPGSSEIFMASSIAASNPFPPSPRRAGPKHSGRRIRSRTTTLAFSSTLSPETHQNNHSPTIHHLQENMHQNNNRWQDLNREINVTLERKTSHTGPFCEIEIYASSESGINHISIDVWFGQYLKIWNLRVQKNINIEKIKFLAMHITNQ